MRYRPWELTRHHPLARRYFTRDLLSGREVPGYTGMDLFKFYGLMVGLFFAITYTYTRYLELFNDIGTKPAGYRVFVALFAGLPLLLLLPAILGFFWWTAGALVDYARWQKQQPVLWRWFWFVVLNFYCWTLLDLMDRILPAMSRNGLAKAPNLILLFSGKFEWFPFQWGWFLLYFLALFLLAALNWSYFMDGWRELWFYTQRVHRYSASVLTGFSQTLEASRSAPVTRLYPQEPARLPAGFRGAPRLNPAASLGEPQALALLSADSSGAISHAPGQPAVLFVDLGIYTHTPALEDLRGQNGEPLLLFDGSWPAPSAGRAELVVPLRRSGA